MGDVGTHTDLHSEGGALPGEHPGRAANPAVKVAGLAWLELTKPDLSRAEAFARAFGLGVVCRTPDELVLSAALGGAPCLLIRRGPSSSFDAMAFQATELSDVQRLADQHGARVERLPEAVGGVGVTLTDPSGTTVRVVSGLNPLSARPLQQSLVHNNGTRRPRANATQRPPRVPSTVQRLGHVALQTTRYRRTLDWYLDNLGLIVSDFLYFEGQRERGPVMSFIRCDNGSVPSDHHTLALVLGPANRYVHSAYEVADLDALAAGGEQLREQGYRRSWGIGRHIQGSQVFDYWRDPDGLLLEHYADGDVFDASLEPGWAPMTVSGLAQWGPPATADFLGITPGRESAREALAVVRALRDKDNEFDAQRLAGLVKAVRS
jgi:catechol 2,3-dioxygenase-like lactoylglutathione lyase family enzyme